MSTTSKTTQSSTTLPSTRGADQQVDMNLGLEISEGFRRFITNASDNALAAMAADAKAKEGTSNFDAQDAAILVELRRREESRQTLPASSEVTTSIAGQTAARAHQSIAPASVAPVSPARNSASTTVLLDAEEAAPSSRDSHPDSTFAVKNGARVKLEGISRAEASDLGLNNESELEFFTKPQVTEPELVEEYLLGTPKGKLKAKLAEVASYGERGVEARGLNEKRYAVNNGLLRFFSNSWKAVKTFASTGREAFETAFFPEEILVMGSHNKKKEAALEAELTQYRNDIRMIGLGFNAVDTYINKLNEMDAEFIAENDQKMQDFIYACRFDQNSEHYMEVRDLIHAKLIERQGQFNAKIKALREEKALTFDEFFGKKPEKKKPVKDTVDQAKVDQEFRNSLVENLFTEDKSAKFQMINLANFLEHYGVSKASAEQVAASLRGNVSEGEYFEVTMETFSETLNKLGVIKAQTEQENIAAMSAAKDGAETIENLMNAFGYSENKAKKVFAEIKAKREAGEKDGLSGLARTRMAFYHGVKKGMDWLFERKEPKVSAYLLKDIRTNDEVGVKFDKKDFSSEFYPAEPVVAEKRSFFDKYGKWALALVGLVAVFKTGEATKKRADELAEQRKPLPTASASAASSMAKAPEAPVASATSVASPAVSVSATENVVAPAPTASAVAITDLPKVGPKAGAKKPGVTINAGQTKAKVVIVEKGEKPDAPKSEKPQPKATEKKADQPKKAPAVSSKKTPAPKATPDKKADKPEVNVDEQVLTDAEKSDLVRDTEIKVEAYKVRFEKATADIVIPSQMKDIPIIYSQPNKEKLNTSVDNLLQTVKQLKTKGDIKKLKEANDKVVAAFGEIEAQRRLEVMRYYGDYATMHAKFAAGGVKSARQYLHGKSPKFTYSHATYRAGTDGSEIKTTFDYKVDLNAIDAELEQIQKDFASGKVSEKEGLLHLRRAIYWEGYLTFINHHLHREALGHHKAAFSFNR